MEQVADAYLAVVADLGGIKSDHRTADDYARGTHSKQLNTKSNMSNGKREPIYRMLFLRER